MGGVRWHSIQRVAAAVAAMALLAVACGGGGGGGGEDAGGAGDGGEATTSTTGERIQHQFHEELLVAVRARFTERLDPRFRLDQSSVRVVDVTRGQVEFKTQKEQAEFGRQQGLVGLGAADFCASNCFEYWGVITWVFQAEGGARAMFEGFPDPERVTIDDATKVDSRGEAYGAPFLGNLSIETYSSPEGITTLFMRGSLVDGNAVHYVSAVVDVPPGQSLDGLAELRRIMENLEGFYAAVFEAFLGEGGTDEPTTTTTRDPNFVPGDQ